MAHQTDIPSDPPLVVGGETFTSRLFLGTGKYPDIPTMVAALAASGTQCVTIAIRRLDGSTSEGPGMLEAIDRDRYKLLPNTAGCFDAETAVRTARLGRELTGSPLVKLEVLGDKQTLLPDPVGTLEAARTLVKEGFTVLCYTSDDPVVALRLEDVGVASVMPAGAPIGSGQGIVNQGNILTIIERAHVPVIVDAGVGTASDVSVAFELGADGVLLNTAVAKAAEPVRMARAMWAAAEAGWDAFRAGRIPKQRFATPSSPVKGVIGGVEGE